LSSGEPTYWPGDPNKFPDLLDFFITKGTSAHYADIVSNLDLSSDHTPVIGTISTTVVYRNPKPSLYNKHTDWEIFKENVRKNLKLDVRLKTEREIDEAKKTSSLQFKGQPGQRPQYLQRPLDKMLISPRKSYS